MSAIDGKEAGIEIRLGLQELAKALAKLAGRHCAHLWQKSYHIGEHLMQECKYCRKIRRVI